VFFLKKERRKFTFSKGMLAKALINPLLILFYYQL
jgi:hypothetical protein